MFSIDQVAFYTLTLAGLGLFLFGISSLSSTLKTMASSRLSKLINKFSNNPFFGFLLGASFTAIIQSSSGTSALTIGLVRAGVMNFVQASAIIIGANVGTTVTSFIVSIPFVEYFPLVLFFGSIILLFATKKKWTNIGNLCFAFGSLFLGLWLMELNLSSIAKESWFLSFFELLNNSPWLGLLIGTLATICLQSSSAVIGVVQGLFALSAGASISLFGILPVIFGANIGTTSTALFASIGGSKESKKVALFHVLFNVTGALLFMGIIYIFKPYLSDPTNFGTLNADGTTTWFVSPMFQIAICHLIFNLVTGLLFFALLKPITNLINKIIPSDKTIKELKTIKPLDNKLMKQFPGEGLALAKERTLSMFSYDLMMFETIKEYLLSFKDEDADFALSIETNIDLIDRQLNEYLSICDKSNLNEEDMAVLLSVLKGSKDIERIGDYGENIINFYKRIKEKKDYPSESEKALFIKMNDEVVSLISRTIKVYENGDVNEGIKIIKERRKFVASINKIIDEHLLDESKVENQISTRFLEMIFVDILNCYERVASHCSNICKIFGTDKNYSISEEDKKHFISVINRN